MTAAAPVVGVTMVHCFQVGHTYGGAHVARRDCLVTDDAGRCVVPVEHAPTVGEWDAVTRGFWEGGRLVTADQLEPGDTFRWTTYTGYVYAGDAGPALPYPTTCVDVITRRPDGHETVIRLGRGTLLEVTGRESDR